MRISREVAIACVVIFISITMCMAMAVVLRLQHYVSAKEMWISIGGISMFVYNVFMSEVLMAAAVSLKKELDMEREGRQREVEDPSWFTTYQAVTSARTMTDRAL